MSMGIFMQVGGEYGLAGHPLDHVGGGGGQLPCLVLVGLVLVGWGEHFHGHLHAGWGEYGWAGHLLDQVGVGDWHLPGHVPFMN